MDTTFKRPKLLAEYMPLITKAAALLTIRQGRAVPQQEALAIVLQEWHQNAEEQH